MVQANVFRSITSELNQFVRIQVTVRAGLVWQADRSNELGEVDVVGHQHGDVEPGSASFVLRMDDDVFDREIDAASVVGPEVQLADAQRPAAAKNVST